tara:strand:- start:88 stop:396 length:309 start_codon:yes stop_codon:yes gene_type:complete
MAEVESKVNYTEEMTTQIVDAYSTGMDVAEIADSIGKSVRSVRSKLVREGVYVAKEKVATRKVEGPSKKEILNQLESTGFEVKGFEGATKEALTRLLGVVTN